MIVWGPKSNGCHTNIEACPTPKLSLQAFWSTYQVELVWSTGHINFEALTIRRADICKQFTSAWNSYRGDKVQDLLDRSQGKGNSKPHSVRWESLQKKNKAWKIAAANSKGSIYHPVTNQNEQLTWKQNWQNWLQNTR